MITIACLNAGNYQDRGIDYVRRLYEGVTRNLTLPHRFVCFTDDEYCYPYEIETRPLPHDGLKGWMNKLALFKPGVFADTEQVWYFDLDTAIVGPIDFIGEFRGRFGMLGPFFENINPVFRGPQSGVMSWTGGSTEPIWNRFAAEGYPDVKGGDQRFINDCNLAPILFQDVFPGKFASYKGHCVQAIPEGVAVVGFHGLPRPHQAGGWVRRMWRGDTLRKSA